MCFAQVLLTMHDTSVVEHWMRTECCSDHCLSRSLASTMCNALLTGKRVVDRWGRSNRF